MKMNQKNTEDAITSEIKSDTNAKPSIRRFGTVIGCAALCALTIGSISICGVVSQKLNITDSKAETATSTVTEDNTVDSYTEVNTIAWKKASINEYDIAETQATTTTSVTTATKAETTAKVTETDVKNVKMYAREIANIRETPDENSQINAMMAVDEYCTVTSKTSNGWYAVKYDNYTGYVLQSSLTKTAPKSAEVATTTAETQKAENSKAETTTKKPATTTAPTTTTAKTTTKADTSSDDYVVACTDEEFEMFTYVIQGEVGNCSEKSKIAVANVILNRVKSDKFPDTIEGVLTANNQFTAISGYYNKTTPPSQNTIDCAKRALAGEDNSNGATFYYSPQYCSASTAAWFESLQLCLSFDNQRYFKNW